MGNVGYGDGVNLYAYVGGDPVNFSDPSGLRADTLDLLRKIKLDGSGSGSNGSICDGCTAVVTAREQIRSVTLFNNGDRNNPNGGERNDGGGVGDMPEPEEMPKPPCAKSGLDTLIGAASAVGSFAQDIGDVGQIIGGVVVFVNPVLGGAIFTGSKVISGVGTGLEVGAALGDAYLNGNTGNLANVGASAVGGLVGGSAFNRIRALEFGGRVSRNSRGQFTRNPANVFAKEIKRTGNLAGSKIAGSAVCR